MPKNIPVRSRVMRRNSFPTIATTSLRTTPTSPGSCRHTTAVATATPPLTAAIANRPTGTHQISTNEDVPSASSVNPRCARPLGVSSDSDPNSPGRRAVEKNVPPSSAIPNPRIDVAPDTWLSVRANAMTSIASPVMARTTHTMIVSAGSWEGPSRHP